MNTTQTDKLEQEIIRAVERLNPNRSDNAEIDAEPLYPDRCVDGENQLYIATLLDGPIPEHFLCDVDTQNGTFVVYRACSLESFAVASDD